MGFKHSARPARRSREGFFLVVHMHNMADEEAWGEAATKYEIHEETLSYFRGLQDMGAKPMDQCTPEEVRATSLRRSEVFAGNVDEFVGSEKQFAVPSETGRSSSSTFPAIPLGFTIFGEIFAYVTVFCFNPNIEVVTFRLRG